ncbi:MAG: transposase [Burkholderiales bacterium]|nr:MAG: transposase [Burkholderiales bacterium]
MARLPRLSLPGIPHHVIQRGNNRQPVFAAPADYLLWLGLLHDNARKFAVAVHAYVLLPARIDLIVTPEDDKGVAQMMQSLGRSYARYFNDSQQRTGTLWEGRYRSNLLEPTAYLMPCMVDLDLSPVRAGLVAEARDHAWSSHGHYAGLRTERLITPHALFWTLGNTPFAREAAYAALVDAGISAQHHEALESAALGGWVLGGERFIADLQKVSTRRLLPAAAGRPPSTPASDK